MPDVKQKYLHIAMQVVTANISDLCNVFYIQVPEVKHGSSGCFQVFFILYTFL